MAISDYSTTAGNNSTISGINIAEGCDAGNMNNAVRQMMADLATYDAAAVSATNWEFISLSEPSSDAATFDVTGLSAYLNIRFTFLAVHDNFADIFLWARASGGTWYQIMDYPSAWAQSAVGGQTTIYNFNNGGTFGFSGVKSIVNTANYFGNAYPDRTTEDVSDLGGAATPATADSVFGWWPTSPIWDEIRMDATGAVNIMGATASRRSFFLIEGQKAR